jgi:uncharacterized FlgJ-related protein
VKSKKAEMLGEEILGNIILNCRRDLYRRPSACQRRSATVRKIQIKQSWNKLRISGSRKWATVLKQSEEQYVPLDLAMWKSMMTLEGKVQWTDGCNNQITTGGEGSSDA